MTTKFLGSSNSRYYAVAHSGRIIVGREDSVLWQREIPFDEFEMVAMGGSGNLFVRGPEGIYVYDVKGDEIRAPLPNFGVEELAAQGAVLGDVRVSGDGRKLFIDRISQQARLTQRIFELLSSTRVEPDQFVHEIFLYNLDDDSYRFFYKCKCPAATEKSQPFMFSTSSDFEWIAFAEPEKGDRFRLAVANLTNQMIEREFLIPGLRVKNINVGRDGTVLLDALQGSERGLVIIGSDGVHRPLTSFSDYTIAHVGNNFVAMKTRPIPFLLVKSFDDKLRGQADLRALDKLELCYDVLFNERDGIDIVSLSEGTIKVMHTNLEFLETDARRWQRLAEGAETEGAAMFNAEAQAEAHRAEVRKQRTMLETPARLEVNSYESFLDLFSMGDGGSEGEASTTTAPPSREEPVTRTMPPPRKPERGALPLARAGRDRHKPSDAASQPLVPERGWRDEAGGSEDLVTREMPAVDSAWQGGSASGAQENGESTGYDYAWQDDASATADESYANLGATGVSYAWDTGATGEPSEDEGSFVTQEMQAVGGGWYDDSQEASLAEPETEPEAEPGTEPEAEPEVEEASYPTTVMEPADLSPVAEPEVASAIPERPAPGLAPPAPPVPLAPHPGEGGHEAATPHGERRGSPPRPTAPGMSRGGSLSLERRTFPPVESAGGRSIPSPGAPPSAAPEKESAGHGSPPAGRSLEISRAGVKTPSMGPATPPAPPAKATAPPPPVPAPAAVPPVPVRATPVIEAPVPSAIVPQAPPASKGAAEPAKATPAPVAPPVAAPAPAGLDLAISDEERRRTEKLLEMLEERFKQAQVTETVYKQLKSKYLAKLGRTE